jgi:hypothetical protein
MTDPLSDLGGLDLGDGPTLSSADPDIKGKGIMRERSDYQYQALKNDKSSIRLLELAPAHSPADDLHIRLVEHDVMKELYKYEPISYVWGPPVFSESLFIDEDYVLKITKSLAEALRHFRLPDQPRLLWADAVCINQNDSDEKSKQVLKMDVIYRQGSKTLAWLGRGFEDNHLSFDSVRNVAARAPELSIYSWSLGWGSNMLPTQLAIALEIVNSLPVDSLRSFFSLGWFSRMWVVQEVVLSAQLQIFCGEESLSLEELVLACAVFRQCMGTVGCGGLGIDEMEPCWYLAQVQSNFQGFLLPFKDSKNQLPFLRTPGPFQRIEFRNNNLKIQLQPETKGGENSASMATFINGQTMPLVPGASYPMHIIRSIELPKTESSHVEYTGIKIPAPDYFSKAGKTTLTIASPMTLLDYIAEAVWSGKKCFDQRVLVYAVIGFRFEHDIRVTPDYSKPIVEVYRDLAVQYLEQQHVRVLYFAAQHRDPLGNQNSFPDDPWQLPSWTPDWRVRSQVKGFQSVLDNSFHAATKALPSISLSDEKLVMNIRGTLISSVQAALRVIISNRATGEDIPEHEYLNYYFEILSMIRRGALNQAEEDGIYPAGGGVLSALARVLTLDYRAVHMHQGKITPRSEKSHGEMWAEFEQRALDPAGDFYIAFQKYRSNPVSTNLSPFDNPNFTELATFIRLMMGHLYKNKFGVLGNRYMGLFPAHAMEEDLVVVFDGAETPFVVREVGEEGDYVLIGDCYVLGLMEGEVLTEEWEGFRMFFSVR